MATLAREKNTAAVYLVDEITATKRHIGKAEYASLLALGWTVRSVPAGTLTPFTDVTAWKHLDVDELAAAITDAGKATP